MDRLKIFSVYPQLCGGCFGRLLYYGALVGAGGFCYGCNSNFIGYIHDCKLFTLKKGEYAVKYI